MAKGSKAPGGSNKKNGNGAQITENELKTIEEREEAYAKARARIFSQDLNGLLLFLQLSATYRLKLQERIKNKREKKKTLKLLIKKRTTMIRKNNFRTLFLLFLFIVTFLLIHSLRERVQPVQAKERRTPFTQAPYESDSPDAYG